METSGIELGAPASAVEEDAINPRLNPQTNSQASLGPVVRAAQAGDLEAFEVLMRAFERPMLRLANRMLGNLGEAQDATQELFLRLHRTLHRMDAERDPAPWLYRMMANLCCDAQKRRGRAFMLPLESIDEPCAHAQDPAEALHDAHRKQALIQALAELPHRERAAVVLRDMEGHSAAEAARLLGSSEGTVRSQACRGRLRLRNLLKGLL